MKSTSALAVCCALLASLASAVAQPTAPAAQPAGSETEQPERSMIPSQVSVLGYHRFEDPARDSLAISTSDFRDQMQALKDAGIEVISMEDFLAWRKGEKEIPEKAAVITIDDGYNCTYHRAWPILKEFDYPFTVYPYTDYISAGGRSITWEQLKEMRDAGVDIGSHSVSHDNLVRPRRAGGANYDEWLEHELAGSKKILEERLGVPMRTFAYPYGVFNERVAQKGLETGYEALFTVVGKKVNRDSPAGELGRYIVQSDKPQTFRAALQFGPGSVRPGGLGTDGPAMSVYPAHQATIAEQRPEIRAELGALGTVDPQSIQMRISGLGLVSPSFDPESGVVLFQPKGRLHHRSVEVTLRARVGGKPIQTGWVFQIDPAALVPSESLLEALEPAQEVDETGEAE